MDFGEVAAHGAHEAAGSAADFESAPGGGRGVGGEAFELAFEVADDIDGGGEEFVIVLIAPSERDVIVGAGVGRGVRPAIATLGRAVVG